MKKKRLVVGCEHHIYVPVSFFSAIGNKGAYLLDAKDVEGTYTVKDGTNYRLNNPT